MLVSKAIEQSSYHVGKTRTLFLLLILSQCHESQHY